MGLRDYFSSPSPQPPVPPPPLAQPTPTPAPAPPPPVEQPKKPNPQDEGTFERIYEGHAKESTDTNVRYAAYAARFRTILNATHRYVAYTSDIGESFRPVTHPHAVKAAYGISWLYLTGDVTYEGYKAYLRNKSELSSPTSQTPPTSFSEATSTSSTTTATTTSELARRNIPSSEQNEKEIPNTVSSSQKKETVIPFHEDYRTIMAERAIFQSLASMAFPAFTIHSVVKYSGKAMKNVKNARLRTWGPVGLGLSVVPGLPYLFDEPVERAVKWVFHKGYEMYSGIGAKGSLNESHEAKKDL